METAESIKTILQCQGITPLSAQLVNLQQRVEVIIEPVLQRFGPESVTGAINAGLCHKCRALSGRWRRVRRK